MSDGEVQGIQRVNANQMRARLRKAHIADKKLLTLARQSESKANFSQWASYSAYSALAMAREFKKLEERTSEQALIEEAQETGPEESADLEQLAKKYSTKNSELQTKTLLAILSRIRSTDTANDILAKVRQAYADHTLADEALDFIIEASPKGSSQRAEAEKAKREFNEIYGREIRAGKNIALQAQEFSIKGLGSPTALRDLYREIIANPRDPHELFNELFSTFKYTQMKAIIDFVLHSLGSDLKAKGSSIPKGELSRLFTESRIMQSLLGLFRFFEKRMPMIQTLFEHEDLAMPGSLSFELLARQLMALVKERYPTPDKVRRLAMQLGISEELAAQIIIFSQYRDALRNISPRLFKSERHRQDLLLALIEALGEIEDEIEEEEEE